MAETACFILGLSRADRELPASAKGYFMKALVYGGPGVRTLVERPKPEIKAPGDAVLRVTRTTICGTDLHILKGDVATCAVGRILGHEGVGVVESVGAGVSAFKPGDRVLISCISSCGRCDYRPPRTMHVYGGNSSIESGFGGWRLIEACA